MSGNAKNRKCFIVMAIILVCFAFTGAARADTNWGKPVPVVTERQKLLALDGIAGDYFGWSVSVSGDYAIVGAYYDDSAKGSAYIFKWNGTIWLEQQKLTDSDGAAGDYFSWSVSISGDYAIVGVRFDDDNGNGSGSAYIFKRDVASWSQQAKLLASDGAAADEFGYSVSISGDLAIVGAPPDDDKGNSSGSAYIFKWNGTNWVQQQKLLASDGAAGDYFGRSVSRSGDYAIVGANYGDGNVINSGSAYIFKWNGTNWVEQQKLTASDGAAEDYFGRFVSISGDYAIVGAYGDDDMGEHSGSAYAFRPCPREDRDGNCKVDFADFAIFADDWLYGTN